MRVVLVGLDVKSSDSIVLNLRLRWPDLEACKTNGAQPVDRLVSAGPDLIVLNAAALGGTQALSEIRKSCDAVIVVVAPEPDEAELVEMLEAGADDYLSLSPSAARLVARVSAALRRAQRPDERSEPPLQCGELLMNPLTHEVLVKGQVIHLTPTEFKLLCHLAKNKGRLVTHEALQALLWGPEGKYYADCLRKYVQRVRQKVGEHANGHLRIETVPRTGYRLLEIPRDDSQPQ